MPWAITQEEGKPGPVSSHPRCLADLPCKMERNGKFRTTLMLMQTQCYFILETLLLSECAWEEVSSSGLLHCLRTHCIRSLLPAWASTSFARRATVDWFHQPVHHPQSDVPVLSNTPFETLLPDNSGFNQLEFHSCEAANRPPSIRFLDYKWGLNSLFAKRTKS